MVLIEGEDRDTPPGPLELSLVLCDDSHIQELNKEWRGKDAPTDVLSFEMGRGYDDDADEEERMTFDDFDPTSNINSGEEEQEEETENNDGEDEEEEEEGPAVTLLGDVVISLDTAARQAKERNHSLHDECRILLVHGVLHLLGYDHEQGKRAGYINWLFLKIFFIFGRILGSDFCFCCLYTGGAEADEMAEAEAKIMKALGWKGDGLIASAETGA
jgi:rRNA maturation RNase YbeY